MHEELETPLSLSKFDQHDNNGHENHKLCKEFFAYITRLSFKLLLIVLLSYDNAHENQKLCKEFFAYITNLSFKLLSIVLLLSMFFHDLYNPNKSNEN